MNCPDIKHIILLAKTIQKINHFNVKIKNGGNITVLDYFVVSDIDIFINTAKINNIKLINSRKIRLSKDKNIKIYIINYEKAEKDILKIRINSKGIQIYNMKTINGAEVKGEIICNYNNNGISITLTGHILPYVDFLNKLARDIISAILF